MDQKHQFMGEEKITKLLFHFSIPAIIGMLVNALYNVLCLCTALLEISVQFLFQRN